MLAPYPTDVGTAKTGHATSPPITLGSGAFMPAMATIAQDLCSVST